MTELSMVECPQCDGAGEDEECCFCEFCRGSGTIHLIGDRIVQEDEFELALAVEKEANSPKEWEDLPPIKYLEADK